jgi:PKD repeat protein
MTKPKGLSSSLLTAHHDSREFPMRGRRKIIGLVLGALASSVTVVGVAAAPAAVAAQGVPGQTTLVPQIPRTDVPKISDGEIFDIEVVPSLNRVFIAGSFTSIADVSGTTTPLPQRSLASYNYNTGKIDRSFRPTFNGAVAAVEASPDGTKLFVGGSFNTVNGVAEQKVASLNITTGAPVSTFAFAASTNNAVTALATTNTTLYVGGRFTRINGVLKAGLAAVNASTGVVDPAFSNDITGGIGVNGALTVPQLKLTHDETKLLVIHTGRQIAGQDRLGMGLINVSGAAVGGTANKALLPWRSRLWDDNIARVGGVSRIAAGDIAPNDQYFVVTAGSGGDAPPISDTAVAFPIAGADNVAPLWVSRHFDSVYSVAITEKAVYLGGHFQFEPSPSAQSPWPGLDNVGYGTGQGLAGYGLGDQVVRRDHLSAVDPATGHALEWDPGSNSFEGNKAMEATPRGLFAGGDATIQGTKTVGRVAFFDLNTVPAASTTDTTITTPIEGRVVTSGAAFTIDGTATAPGGIKRVQVEIQDRNTHQYLQDDGVTFGPSNNIFATLAAGATAQTPRAWSLPITITGNHPLTIMAKTFGNGGSSDATKATKKIESFSFDDQTPATGISGPTASILASTSFTMTGIATDDHGIDSLSFWFRDENNNYLQDDGTVGPIFNTFSGTPDVIGATAATWSFDVTVPHEGIWRGSATATDTAGQADLRSAVRDWTISSTAVAPTVTINQPVAMTPPFAVPAVVVAPGSPITFSGTAADDGPLQNVEITLRNTTTRENLGADGTWGVNVTAGVHRISPVDINASTYNWTYTTPFTLTPGTYSFTVRATDHDQLTTATANRGSLTLNAQIPGDSPPDGLLNFTPPTTVGSLHVDLTGTATDDHGVASVRVAFFDTSTGRYVQPDGTSAAAFATINASLTSLNSTSTAWTLPFNLPNGGNYNITAWAFDTAGQQDLSTIGATAVYAVWPGDAVPTFDATLGAPVDGATFDQGRIVVTGRANDDISIARVEVGVVNSLGQYMSATGTFTSTVPSFRTAFLNSPGSPGSNFSYTTPVIPSGTYSVVVRPTDQHGQIGALRTNVGIVVTRPANLPPVAHGTVSCVKNVCTFDARTSTDEDTSTLTYSWVFGTTQGTATGPLPVKTFTAPGTFPVTLTVTDEWGVTATTTLNVTVTEPLGNVAPVPTFTTSCIALACGTSSAGTVDPNLGDVITYSWNWGDASAASTGATASHTYAVPGTYTITLTTTDGWLKSASTTHQVVLVEPVGNVAPVATFTSACVALACQTNSAGTNDPNGDVIRYSWNFGDASALSTAASPAHTYAAAGTYTIALTVTDGWNRSTTTTRQVTMTEPVGNVAPVVVFSTACTSLTCLMDSTGTNDPNGDAIRFSWNFGDATAAGATASLSHSYAAAGTFMVTLTVTDGWNRSTIVTHRVTVAP